MSARIEDYSPPCNRSLPCRPRDLSPLSSPRPPHSSRPTRATRPTRPIRPTCPTCPTCPIGPTRPPPLPGGQYRLIQVNIGQDTPFCPKNLYFSIVPPFCDFEPKSSQAPHPKPQPMKPNNPPQTAINRGQSHLGHAISAQKPIL